LSRTTSGERPSARGRWQAYRGRRSPPSPKPLRDSLTQEETVSDARPKRHDSLELALGVRGDEFAAPVREMQRAEARRRDGAVCGPTISRSRCRSASQATARGPVRHGDGGSESLGWG
jgi:hypothetical protein